MNIHDSPLTNCLVVSRTLGYHLEIQAWFTQHPELLDQSKLCHVLFLDASLWYTHDISRQEWDFEDLTIEAGKRTEELQPRMDV